MHDRKVIWSPAVMEKLTMFRSEKYTPEETFDFISQIILETEGLLENDIIGKSYNEEFGKYKGISRVVVKKFRVYYKLIDNDVVILAVLFPGEN
ncbi:MAG: type II toxin-antitoxin system RelE/ParE family toxin [Bacillaceae bacterium]|uniref:Type II toxin-antitoxin system RelE/ParE family toxin n=1 Tax=Alkalihalobacterium chitinilyticum TaxID=2980103 RepID=A0ABT5VI79_9BACI|nr:type II toxin-antitoxin system RelE/ParE family toxin [Alkalihalobacterium chitinilyticum]MDE5415163.1 type II toxin-antitoxin system RelE/ParE family toxin [Alkalihalobacterium chitinilyticum]MEB1809607.1 type II toxin-antitoxin system RelE/ParE family toxin [Bacillaceae bacterium]